MRSASRTTGTLSALFLLAACAKPAVSPSPAGDAMPSRRPDGAGPVVVALVVDQLAAWVAADRLGELPKDGGFARLRGEGTWVRDLRFGHAITETAPGHSALFTGRVPRESGVTGNELFDAVSGKTGSFVRDGEKHAVGADGERKSAGASLARLKVDTIADRLRAAKPDAVILALSLKDRGAVFGGGRAPTASVWFDSESASWVTGTAFAKELPAWARTKPDLAAATWELSRPGEPEWVAAHAATPDDQPGETDGNGITRVFPHVPTAAKSPGYGWMANPAADAALLDVAIAALDASGAASHPTFLEVSLSTNDYVGHAFGPDSWEAWDELRRLDASLARFFEALDQRFGPGGWSALLTADHGVTPLVETAQVPRGRPWCATSAKDRWERPCDRGVRVSGAALLASLQAAATKAMEREGAWVAAVVEPRVIFGKDAAALDDAGRAKLVAALREALGHTSGVDQVFDAKELAGPCPPLADESTRALVCRSIVPGEPGDLYVTLRSGSAFELSRTPGMGTGHGAPRLHDRAVPLLVRAPGRIEARKVIDTPTRFDAFTRAASDLLGVPSPAPDDAPVLVQPAR